MTRKCAVTGKRPLSGNNVSHANNKTKRRFLPNLQSVSLYSESLGRSVRLRVTAHGLKVVEAKGGLDSYVLRAKELPKSLNGLRKKLFADQKKLG